MLCIGEKIECDENNSTKVKERSDRDQCNVGYKAFFLDEPQGKKKKAYRYRLSYQDELMPSKHCTEIDEYRKEKILRLFSPSIEKRTCVHGGHNQEKYRKGQAKRAYNIINKKIARIDGDSIIRMSGIKYSSVDEIVAPTEIEA